MSEPGCPVRGKEGLCKGTVCDTFIEEPHHEDGGNFTTLCPGTLDAEPGPDCERRSREERRNPLTPQAAIAQIERRSYNERRKAPHAER